MVRCRIRLPVRTSTRRVDGGFYARSALIFLPTMLLIACAGSEPAPEAGRRANDPVSTVGPKGTWREIDVPLPPYPQAENLVEFQISGSTSFKFFADLTSVRVDTDGVVRYTVIARSASGTENVSFEGIHCESEQYKIYAFGSIDGTWLPPRNPNWQPVKSTSVNDVRRSLHHYYLCPLGVPPTNTQVAVRAMKRGRPYFDDYRKF